jgi:1-phosphatidylinositol phosphodiesterase
MRHSIRLTLALLLSSSLGVLGGGNDWMTSLDGTQPLSQLSIPGTHNAGARFEPLSGTAKCQSLTIREQLDAGVRFMDIRCRHINDDFSIHHGQVYQKISFRDVLNDTLGFLAANPGETVILSINQTHKAENNTRSFEATFDSFVAQNPNKWRLSASIPTLNEARGKIVLFRRFGANGLPKGIDASKWPNNTTFSIGKQLRIQDRYVVSENNDKWGAIEKLLKEAKAGDPNTLFVNFASGYKPGLLGIPNITKVSNSINPRLADFFEANPKGRYGAILMDFVDAETASLIYKTNLPHQDQGSPAQR